MTTYLAYFKLSFKQNTIYRVEWLMGILNTCLQIFISVAIWKALYGDRTSVGGVDFSVIATNFIISQGLSNAFATSDSAIQRKLRDGSIANELLKPVDYRKILLAQNLGNTAFNFVSNFLPSLIITGIFIGMLPPAGLAMFGLYLASMVLGFGVLWSLSLIVQMSAFWIMNIWSVSTIKGVLINILAGASLPLWFMPEPVLRFIEWTPFQSIYYIPLKIYLGQLGMQEILWNMGKQCLWIVILYSLSVLLWKKGQKKIVIQGG